MSFLSHVHKLVTEAGENASEHRLIHTELGEHHLQNTSS